MYRESLGSGPHCPRLMPPLVRAMRRAGHEVSRVHRLTKITEPVSRVSSQRILYTVYIKESQMGPTLGPEAREVLRCH
ncbi:hypothetical protein TNCV_2625351 [Trichonephila clavipes]|nr:hypothetical protein TNCV_2625351 [Trichonephila clavipes]